MAGYRCTETVPSTEEPFDVFNLSERDYNFLLAFENEHRPGTSLDLDKYSVRDMRLIVEYKRALLEQRTARARKKDRRKKRSRRKRSRREKSHSLTSTLEESMNVPSRDAGATCRTKMQPLRSDSPAASSDEESSSIRPNFTSPPSFGHVANRSPFPTAIGHQSFLLCGFLNFVVKFLLWPFIVQAFLIPTMFSSC